ncbi:MAG: hypothetical protein LBD30_05850 [Verrucomicrobiales bacterium]|nr:hypothetical protein [Verrucomicrobiales bacterium]
MADARRIARYIQTRKSQVRYLWRINRTGLLRLVTRLERKRERAKVTGWLEELPCSQGTVWLDAKRTFFLKRVAGEYLRKAWRSGRMAKTQWWCNWIIREWGGITARLDMKDFELIWEIARRMESGEHAEVGFRRVASVSKILAFWLPREYVIYDSRVAMALNGIMLLRRSGGRLFPVPSRFESARTAGVRRVLEWWMKQSGREEFARHEAYAVMNKLVKQVNGILFAGDKREREPVETEMLLFAMADKVVGEELRVKMGGKFGR